jgi:HEAT repeat protein
MNCFRLVYLLATVVPLMSVFLSESLQAQGNEELLEIVVGLLNDEDKDMRAIGLEQVRTELKGEAVTEQLLAILPKLKPAGQIALIAALGDRGDVSACPAIIEIVKDDSRDVTVRATAVQTLGALGNETHLPLLVELLANSRIELQIAARTGLLGLRGNKTLRAMSDSMALASPAVQIKLIEILVQRRTIEALPNLVTAAQSAEPAVRTAAMKALGEIGTPEQLPGMVAGVLKAERGREREAAEKAIMFVCQRIGTNDVRALPLLAAIKKRSPADQLTLLSTLGRVGGPGALEVIEERISSPDGKEHELGIRALCNWPDASNAGRLLELIDLETRPEFRSLLLNALIRVAPLPDGRSLEARLELLQTATKLCTQDSERILILKRAPAIRSVETLRFVMKFFDQPALAAQAHEAVVELAHHRSLREPNQAEFVAALDQVLAASKDDVVLDRAQRYKNGQTWVRPAD